MPEFYIGTKHGEFGLEDWQALIARFPEYAPRAMASALRSEGHRMQQMLKYAIMLQGLFGLDIPPLHPHTYSIQAAKRTERRRNIRIKKGIKVRKRRYPKEKHGETKSDIKPLQRLAGSIRYFYDNDIQTVTIGPLNPKWKGLMKLHAEGYSRSINSRMRRMMFAAGFPLAKGTSQLKVPPRPIVSKVFAIEKATILKNVASKAMRNIYRYLTGKSKEQVEKEWTI